MKHSKTLVIFSVIEIVLGIGSIVAIQWLLGQPVSNLSDFTLEQAQAGFAGLILIYGADVFKIFAGVVGILRSNNKSLVTVILGALLVIAQLWTFVQMQSTSNMVIFAINILLMLVPYMYLHSAYKNYKA